MYSLTGSTDWKETVAVKDPRSILYNGKNPRFNSKPAGIQALRRIIRTPCWTWNQNSHKA